MIDAVEQVKGKSTRPIQGNSEHIATIRRAGQRICCFVITVGYLFTLAGQTNRSFYGEVHIIEAKSGRRAGGRPIGTIINGDQIARVEPDATRNRG